MPFKGENCNEIIIIIISIIIISFLIWILAEQIIKKAEYFNNTHLNYQKQTINYRNKKRPWFSNYSGYLNNDNVIPLNQMPYIDAEEAIINNKYKQKHRTYIR